MSDSITFAVPPGIGDLAWCFLKMRQVASGRDIHLAICGDAAREIDCRSLPFVKRFSFVKSACVLPIAGLVDYSHPTDEHGRYCYPPDGLSGPCYHLWPNRVLEAGERIETWLPQYPVDWDVFDEMWWEGTGGAERLACLRYPFVAFYLGPETGHVEGGHNYQWLWEPRHWIELAGKFIERGMRIVLVGAHYDRSFWERYVEAGVMEAGQSWVNLIGCMEIGETLALLRRARCLIAYQCGLAVMTHYLGGRAMAWWRPEEKTANPHYRMTFSEKMKDAWIRPGWEHNWHGLIYTRETPDDIIRIVDERGWLK